jgi:L-cystine transport system permease protein
VSFDFVFMARAFWLILPALPMTLLITAASLFFGLVLAVLLAYAEVNRLWFWRPLARGFVSFFRGTPLMLHIFLIYYGFPHFFDLFAVPLGLPLRGNAIPLVVLVILAFSLNTSAYLAETLRAGVSAISRGEVEAAWSIGMTAWQTWWRILLPQAVTITLPNLGSRLINVLHGSSLAFWISVVEVTGKANLIAASSYQFVEAFLAAAAIYWLTTLLIEAVVARVEKSKQQVMARGMA